LYRRDVGYYSGRRNEEQQMIAEFTSEEAHLLIDGVALGVLSLGGIESDGETIVDRDGDLIELDDIEKAGHTWKDVRTEFARLLVGVGVMTNRLERDGHLDHSYANMQTSDRIKVASVLLGDFFTHNALRFGVEGSGVRGVQHKKIYTDDGGVTQQVIIDPDKDKAKTEAGIDANMQNRGLFSDDATHPAGKISPAKYKELRKAHPEIDKDKFDQGASYYTNFEEYLNERE
jgi:hypothetical protein